MIRRLCAGLAVFLAVAGLTINSADWSPGYKPPAFAIRDAKIVVKPGQAIEKGTIVVRRGLVEQVGKAEEVKLAADTFVVDGKGLTVYPGWIDAYTLNGLGSGVTRSKTGTGRNLPVIDFSSPFTPPDDRIGITPEFQVAESLALSDGTAEGRRKLGFTSQIVAPGGAILTGQGALASTTGYPRREIIIVPEVGLHVNLRPPFEPNPAPTTASPTPGPGGFRFRGGGSSGGPTGYPSALMGIIAHLRQNVLDARHHRQQLEHYAKHGGNRVAADPALDTILAAIDGKLPVWWQAESQDEIHRALDLSKEFGFKPVIVGGREAYKVVDRLKAEKVPVILKLTHPAKPKVPTKEEYAAKKIEERNEPLRLLEDRLAQWKKRVAGPGLLHKAGVKISFSTDGLQRSDQFTEKVRDLIAEGLPESAALEAMTLNVAELAGVGKSLGTLEKGKAGHLVALTGDLNDAKAKVRLAAADGLMFDFDAPTVFPKKAVAGGPGGGSGQGGPGGGGGPGGRRPDATKKGGGGGRRPPEFDEYQTGATQLSARDLIRGEAAEEEVAEVAELQKDEPQKPEAKKGGDRPEGGRNRPERDIEKPKGDRPAGGRERPQGKDQPNGKDEPKGDSAKSKDAAEKTKQQPAKPAKPFVDTPIELEVDRAIGKKTGGNVLIRNATVVTVSKAGILPKASILVQGGKIAAIGTDLKAPEGVMEINAEGLYVMPGMIDTHSHMAIQGGVNEATLSIVPEVRVADVIDGDDPAIYRALAGGTTAARLLHGSANTIGGQDAIIKLRPGHPGRDILLRDSKRPQGVKFALGENVTRRTNRFPTTRLGVEATIERAFQEGKAYADAQKAWEAASRKDPATAGPPPRRDLRLEALARIVGGDIKIHSHCYRADEILMLLRTAERHNVRVQSLQHVLEGYKVAAEIAAHGASASTFSDWWAYKVEAFDAVPANAAILTEAGANAVIKSDDAELVRHLNLEAAKSVKYGSMPEEQALALVTINAARELGLDHRMGSIEVGKDADLAIFDAHPLDTLSQCRLTLINGEIEFQKGKTLEEATKPKKLGELARNPNASKKRVLDFKDDPDNRRVRAFVGGRVHPVDGPTITKGVVIVENDRIKAVGGADTPIPNGAEVVNLEGLDIWPGLIDSGSRVGLTEVGSLRETQDVADSATFQPELIAGTALNPDSEIIPVTRANGVLTVLAQPGGGVISGQSSLANLAGWVPSQMVLVDKVALQVQIPGYVPPRDSGLESKRASHECECEEMATGFADHAHEAMADDPSPEVENIRNEARQRRTQRLEEIADQFKQASAYGKAREAAAKGEVVAFKADPRMEAMLPYARGEKPVIFQANHRAEILDALFLAKALKLKAIIGGGQEAWKVATELKEAGVPVLISGVLQLPGESHDPYDAAYTNAAKLQAAGVKFALQSGGGGPDEATAARNLPFEAGTAAAFGLSEEAALKSVTLAPAEILGVADQLGSIKAGKKANLVVSRGSILQATTPVVLLVIDGRVLKPESRHTRLADKYRERLRQVKEGMVPLGVKGK